MRLIPRGKRNTTAAAVASLALALALGSQAIASPSPADSPSSPTTAEDATAARQYEVTGLTSVADRTTLATSGVAIDEVHQRSVVITADASQAERLRGLGYELTALPSPAEAQGVNAAAPEDYHTYEEVLAAVDEATAQYPELVSSQVIGQSYEGTDIIAIKISDNVGTDEDEPEVLFTHNQHAREHLTVEMALYLLSDFTTQYGTDAALTELLDSREVWIVPSANPDGKAYDTESGEFQNWRLNRQPNEDSSIGTDLNRNWPYEWGCCGGSSGTPGSETYRGPSPESAPETQVVADFVRGRVVGGEQQITAHIDWHTYSELVLWPYGFTYDDTAPGLTADDAATFQELGTAMAETNGYTPQQSSDLYVTDGTIDDWMWGDQGIFSYTFEMYPTSSAEGGFYPPGDVIDAETARNREAVLMLLDYADCPYRIIGEEAQYCAA
jgi:carboxypeptidase T